MNKFQISQMNYTSAYGILCAAVETGNLHSAVYPTFCRIEVGGQSKAHSHFENEIFYIISGQGEMEIASERASVRPGDLIVIPSGTCHQLTNAGSDELAFLSVYSEDTAVPRLETGVIVTAAPPTPNGPLHLGHISGPYLAADILQRALRQNHVSVVSHAGTDDHQNYVFEKALALKQGAPLFQTQMRNRIASGLASMNIQFDEFIEPSTDLNYQKKIDEFAQRALRSGVLQAEELMLPHCGSCDHFLVDALVEGNCPVCGETSRGGCEGCGEVVMPQELKNICCTRCESPAQFKVASVHTFSLGRHLPLIQSDLLKLNLPAGLQKLSANVSRKKNLKVLVSYPDGYGQGLPMPGTEQRLHVWFEMAAHYESFALSSKYWVHSFGFDNSFYYLLFIPALLKALNAKSKMPDAVLTNYFLQLDGKKFSTSRNHAIWADEFRGNADVLRLFLALNRPANTGADFFQTEFQSFSRSVEAQLQQLVKRAKEVSKCESIGSNDQFCRRMTRDMQLFLAPGSFDLRRAARRILEFMDVVLQQQGGEDEKLLLETLAKTMSPLLPVEAGKILQALNLQSRELSDENLRI